MAFSFKNVEKLIKEVNERIEKTDRILHNKKIGYAPKCKVCNSEHLDKIEKLREDGLGYEEILRKLEIDNISIMSLSRHFKNHYPKSQAYKDKQQLEMLESIREAYLKYPFLENYFKDRDLEFLEEFNNDNGFCTDKFSLCKLIPAGTVSNCTNTVKDITKKMLIDVKNLNDETYISFNRNDDIINIKLNNIYKFNFCLECKESINSKRLDLLEKIITYNFLNIPPENRELYFNLLNYDGNPEEFIEVLTEANKINSPAK